LVVPAWVVRVSTLALRAISSSRWAVDIWIDAAWNEAIRSIPPAVLAA